jgi:hypothetical protein
MPGFAMAFEEPQKKLSLMRKTMQSLYGGNTLDDVGAIVRKLTRT